MTVGKEIAERSANEQRDEDDQALHGNRELNPRENRSGQQRHYQVCHQRGAPPWMPASRSRRVRSTSIEVSRKYAVKAPVVPGNSTHGSIRSISLASNELGPNITSSGRSTAKPAPPPTSPAARIWRGVPVHSEVTCRRALSL